MNQISNEVLDVLRSAQVDGNAVILTCGQLDLKTYKGVNEALDRIGGKWNSKRKAHLFDTDPAPKLAEITESGTLAPAPPKNPNAFFPTPVPVVERLLDLIDWPAVPGVHDIPGPARFLEPSAGQGAIADALWKRDGSPLGIPEEVEVCEIDPANIAILKDKGFNIIGRDFLALPWVDVYDVVAMNPPFSVPGDSKAYITHIEHAWKFVAPGGQLVSVAPPFDFQSDNRTAAFREFVETNGYWEPLEKGSFKASGTMTNTVLIHLRKATP